MRLLGFPPALIENRFHVYNQHFNGVDRETLNYLIHLGNKFQIDTIEFFNAVAVFSSIDQEERTPPAVVFLAALRLSVFSRRRRDILQQNQEDVQQILLSSNCRVDSVTVAESTILSNLGCCIWDSRTNLIEAIHVNLERMNVSPDYMGILRNTAVDVAYIMLDSPLMSKIGVLPLTTWEGGIICIITALCILEHSSDAYTICKKSCLGDIEVTERVHELIQLLVNFIVH